MKIAVWKIAMEHCTDKSFTNDQQINNLKELCLELGRNRGVEKNKFLRIFIQDLKKHIINH